MHKRIKKGFTLIELVIVISIIAVLSGVSLFALSGARESGRDARRKADLQEIASGLELYKADQNYYPQSISFGGTNTLEVGSNIYIQVIPNDPNTSWTYFYRSYDASNTTPCPGSCVKFQLWALLEDDTATTPTYCTGTAPSCGSGGSCNYCVLNP